MSNIEVTSGGVDGGGGAWDKFSGAIRKNKVYLFYTLCNFFNQLAYGINGGIPGPALADLMYVYNTEFKIISFLATFASFGYMLGSLAGWAYRWINRQVLLILFIAVHALTIAIVPFCGHYIALFVVMTLNGIGAGAWDSSNSIWLVEMWPDLNSVTLQVSQFTFGVGTIIGPLLVAPFVYGEASNDTNSKAFNVTAEERQHSLALPFAISGMLQIVGKDCLQLFEVISNLICCPHLVPVAFLVMYFMRPYKQNLISPALREAKRPSIYNTCNSRASFQSLHANVSQHSSRHPSIYLRPDDVVDPDSVRYRFAKLSLCALAIAAYSSVEVNYFYFSPSYLQKLSDPMSAAEAARVTSILATAYSTGRLLTAIISIKLVPDVIVSYHYVLFLVGQGIIYFGGSNRTCIYAGTIILGFGFSAVWPASLAFTERHLRLSDRVGSIYSFITGILSLISPLIISQYMTTHPTIIFILGFGFGSLSIVAFIAVNLLIRFTGTKKQ